MPETIDDADLRAELQEIRDQLFLCRSYPTEDNCEMAVGIATTLLNQIEKRFAAIPQARQQA